MIDMSAWADMAAQLDNTAYRVLALTFDDGPVGGYTRNAVKTLGHHGAVGTFFVIGTCVRASPEGARRAADAGNPLGGHSMYHKYGYQIKAEMVPEDHALFVQTLQRHTGKFRGPGKNDPHDSARVAANLTARPRAGL